MQVAVAKNEKMRLVNWNDIERQIDLTRDFNELSSMHNRLEAIKHATNSFNGCLRTCNKAGKYRIKIEMTIGKMYGESEDKSGSRVDLTSSTDLTKLTTKQEALKEIGKSRELVNRWVKESKIPEEKLEEYESHCNENNQSVSSHGFLTYDLLPYLTRGTGENEWYTPADFIAAVRGVLGEIDLDPASNEQANKIVKAHRFYSQEDDGLNQSWHGRVFVNPPYSRGLMMAFTSKLIIEYDVGNIESVILLSHNNTETNWFQKLNGKAVAICFPKNRIKFYNKEFDYSSPVQGQAVFYLGKNKERFIEVFSNIGEWWCK